MSEIPDDLDPILREIDAALKARGVPPQGRSIAAIMEFGNRFSIPMPLTPVPPYANLAPDVPKDLARNSIYTEKINAWFSSVYGERLKVDFSEDAKVAVFSNGDIWEMRIPLIYGTAVVVPNREIKPNQRKEFSREVLEVNPCESLTHVTPMRLTLFSDEDLAEVYSMFIIGLDVRTRFDRFRNANQLFVEAETDWRSAVSLLTAQNPNFGQSRWASLQMCEKFMKGIIGAIGEGNPRQGHRLDALHSELSKSIRGMDLRHLLPDLQCSAEVRYGETPSSREQAYSAHKAALLLVRSLGSVRNPNAEARKAATSTN